MPGEAGAASGDAIGPAINPSARPASSSANRSRLRRSRPPGGGAGGRERTGAITQASGLLPGAVTQRDPTGTGMLQRCRMASRSKPGGRAPTSGPLLARGTAWRGPMISQSTTGRPTTALACRSTSPSSPRNTAALNMSSIGNPMHIRGVVWGAHVENCAPLQRRQADDSVGPMTTPPGFPGRPSVGRSSFAVAMKDYTFIRPGIAVTISAITLALALVIGLWLIFSLNEAAQTVARGAETSASLHRYNAGLEVWREMATSTDPRFRRVEAVAQRDSLGRQLRAELADLGDDMPGAHERELVQTVLSGLTSSGTGTGTDARQAMIVLLAKQDSTMFQAAEASQRAVLLAAVLLALTIIAAGMLIVPMAWLYVRYKRGATIEVKV